jgi:D-3-phosphoglycerate dehydrogenase
VQSAAHSIHYYFKKIKTGDVKESSVTLAPQIVLVDSHVYEFGDQWAAERAAWEKLGAKVSLARSTTEAEIIEAGKDADILIYLGLYTPFTERVLSQLPKCQLITRYGIGMETVDLDAATKYGIVVANAAEYCVPEVADHTMILSLARRVTALDRYVRAGKWAEAMAQVGPITRLSLQTVGIIGLGRIGRHVARNLSNIFGTLLAYDPYVSQEQADAYQVKMVSMDDVLAQSDYVTVHTPLMAQTRGLIGAEQLAKMQPTAFLINTSRGPVVDEAALIDALESKQIAGAALDVFDSEPLAEDSPLRQMDHVILTPHTAAASVQAGIDLRAAVTATVSDVIQGYLPRHILNANVTSRFGLRRR